MSGIINEEIRNIREDHANFLEKSCKLILGYLFVWLYYVTFFGLAMTSFSDITSNSCSIYSSEPCTVRQQSATNLSGVYFGFYKKNYFLN